MSASELAVSVLASPDERDGELKQVENLKLKEMAGIREVMRAAMLGRGVAECVVMYEGGGDEGGVCDVNFWMHDGSNSNELMASVMVEFEKVESVYVEGVWVSEPKLVKKLIEDAADDLWTLAINHFVPTGWELGDGGRGELKLTAATGEIELEHADRIVQEEVSNYSLGVDLGPLERASVVDQKCLAAG